MSSSQQYGASTIAQARVRSATLCGGLLSPPLEDATAPASVDGGAAGSGGSNSSSSVWALRAHSPPPALAEKVAAWRESKDRPASTFGLRRNKSLTHRDAGAGSFLHSDPSPSPIPPSLENSPYLQCEASPFYRRARLTGRAATSSVLPTLKSLNISIEGTGSTCAPPACALSAISTPATLAADENVLVDSPRPAHPQRPGVHQRTASTPTRRAVSESSSGRSSSSNSGDSDSDGSVTGGFTPRTPPLRAAGLPGSPTAGSEQQLKARPGMPARSSYPVMTGSGKVHPPGRPTLAALLPHAGAFPMERIEHPHVRVNLGDRS